MTSAQQIEARTVLLHGLGSSAEHTWARHGWTEVLQDDGRDVMAIDLPGHAGAPPLDRAVPEGGGEVVSRVWTQIGSVTVDLVGFSAGAIVALAAAIERPGQVRRLVLLGLGDAVLDGLDGPRLAEAIDGDAAETELIRRGALSAGNSLGLVADLARHGLPAIDEHTLSKIACPVLVVNGTGDPAGSAPRLVHGMGARLARLRGVDHFGTPASHQAMIEVVGFLAER